MVCDSENIEPNQMKPMISMVKGKGKVNAHRINMNTHKIDRTDTHMCRQLI